MSEIERRPLSRARMAAIGRPTTEVVRTADRPRPQYEGLFREPDLPPYAEEDEG